MKNFVTDCSWRHWHRVVKRFALGHAYLLSNALDEHSKPLALANLAVFHCAEDFAKFRLLCHSFFRSASNVLLVHSFAEIAIFGVLLYRQKRGGVEGKHPRTFLRR